jgi:hypothetical protein
MKPRRLQLSRKKGFRLQDHSRSVNGLPAVNVARPSGWGNRFKIATTIHTNPAQHFEMTPARAVRLHRQWIERCLAKYPETMIWALDQLRGRNLACWCAPGAPCHADTLLELANRDPET